MENWKSITMSTVASELEGVIEKKKVRQQLRAAVREFDEKYRFAKYSLHPISYLELATSDEEEIKLFHRNLKVIVGQLQSTCTLIEVKEGMKLRLSGVKGTRYYLKDEDEYGQVKMTDVFNGIQNESLASIMDVESSRKWNPKVEAIDAFRIEVKIRFKDEKNEYCNATLELSRVIPL